MLQRALEGRRSLARLLTETPEAPVRTPLPAPDPAALKAAGQPLLAAETLYVGAPGAQRPAVRGASFALHPGSAVGIAGPSASGKSTLARALTGVWPALSGKVTLAGAEIDQYGEAALARHLGWLPQEVVLFEGTVAENIARLDPDPDADAAIEAARHAGAHEMILDLPGGYDFEVAAGGAALSGGQRQRIALARAFYGDPAVVVLDEPDAHLDAEGAAALGRAVAALKARGGAAVNRDAMATSIERVLLSPEVVRLTRPPRSAEGRADMAHTRLYSTRHNLKMEQEVRDMAAGMTAGTEHSLSAQAIEAKVAGLLKAGYPLSEEQIAAIRTVTSSGGRVAIIEGAAGSGKTTTLRPIADLYREHGQSIIATAVAWRTAVALGNDVDARPFCVDKLLRLAARGGIDIDGNTTIIVDEAGMLSTRQAHHILHLSERHGAKIVFAGDTQQQQPVEAGPGLRLIRDAVGSVRVDRIRRQKADLEDILVHVHGETPEAARLRSGLMGSAERTRILSDYESMEEKPQFTPWQVSASEALRDGDAASAIAAHHARGRFHIGYDEEKTLTGLVDDWDRYQRANPGKSSVVLARTRAEVRALSHLMRERRFAALSDGERTDTKRVTVIVSRGTEDERTASPLKIARGDRMRIGATHWEKQLFNGTVVTVEDFKVERTEAGTEASVLISGHTEDGRKVSFRHDEIRDWYGNIRLDHGYALTITSAQGLTVDRTFLLADARPARETIYPAATRHREGLDIYVNRAPLALDIADRRADNDREVAVTDTEIRAYLAERWSRSQPKEAALDYMADGTWENQRQNNQEVNARSIRETHGESPEARAAANDNALARIARNIRRATFGWRHAQAVSAFADGRGQVLAAYDDLRERTRAEGDTVALGRAYRDTLNRHAVLLKQAAAFRARPGDFASLLRRTPKSSAGFSLPRTTQRGKRARRRRRPSTTISNARPISTKRPAMSGAMSSTLIPPSSGAAKTLPKIRNRHKNSPPPRKRPRSAPARPRRTPKSSAGFSRPRTTQRGKRANRHRRPSTTISNARPISTTRPGKKSARPVRSPGD